MSNVSFPASAPWMAPREENMTMVGLGLWQSFQQTGA